MLPVRTPVDLYAPAPPTPPPAIDYEHIAGLMAESGELAEMTRELIRASRVLHERLRRERAADRS